MCMQWLYCACGSSWKEKKKGRELIPTSPGTLVRYIPPTLISWIRVSVLQTTWVLSNVINLRSLLYGKQDTAVHPAHSEIVSLFKPSLGRYALNVRYSLIHSGKKDYKAHISPCSRTLPNIFIHWQKWTTQRPITHLLHMYLSRITPFQPGYVPGQAAPIHGPAEVGSHPNYICSESCCIAHWNLDISTFPRTKDGQSSV